MLSEFAIVPQVFGVPAPEEMALHESSMAQLNELLLNYGLVRNLRGGQWKERLSQIPGGLSVRGRMLIEVLCKSGRLREAECTPLPPPDSADDWLSEARRSHMDSPRDRRLMAILSPHVLALEQNDPLVVSTDRIHEAPWWQKRSCSLRLDRTTADYLRCLRPVFLHSNSIMFVDPNLDPTKPNYAEFADLLALQAGSNPRIHLEIHRSCKDGKEYPSRNEWIERFQELTRVLARGRSCIDVFVWDDFHDRYLISNLLGLSVPNGFDVCTDPEKFSLRTTWTRLSRPDADEVQRFFDSAHQPKRLRWPPFRIG